MDQSWPARYADTESGPSRPVRIRLTDRGIAIDGIDPGADPLLWPYGAVASAPRLSVGTATATIVYRYMLGHRLEIASAEALLELARRAPSLTTAAAASRRIWQVLAAGLAATVIGVCVFLWMWGPARTLAGLIPDGPRDAIARQFAAGMVSEYGRCLSPPGEAALAALSGRLMVLSPGMADEVDVRVLDWDIVNAFAGPGGQVFLTRGLIEKARSPDEVAGVLAHEIGHALARHPEAGVIRTFGTGLTLDMIFGGSGTIASLAGLVTVRSYQRDDEREADTFALGLLREAGISQQGLHDFFDRISALGSTPPALGQIVSTHPDASERAARIAATARYPVTPALSQADWRALKAICSVASRTM